MRENTCLSSKKKDPLPKSGTKGLPLRQNYFVEECSAISFLIKFKRGQHQNLFLIKDRLRYFQRGCIWYWKLKPLLCSKAVIRKQLVEVEISSDHSRKGTKKPPVRIGGFFVRSVASVSLFPLRRISTPHKSNIINVTTRGMLSIWVPQLSHVPIL